jgi:hypothetical protein
MQPMHYIGLDVYKKKDQLLRERRRRQGSCRRMDTRHTL